MTIRALAIAVAVTLILLVVATLSLAAAQRAYGRPGAAVLLALAAVFIAQGIGPLVRRRHR